MRGYDVVYAARRKERNTDSHGLRAFTADMAFIG